MGYPRTELQKALCAALAPFVELPLNDETRSDEDRAKITEWLADGNHYLRVHGDMGITWRIVVAVREVGANVKGEIAIAIYNMAKPEAVTLH